MPLQGPKEANVRLLQNKALLTEEEIQSLLVYVYFIEHAAKERLHTEVALQQLLALKRQEQLATRQIESFDAFDASTANANKWMLRFTAAVTFMTLVLVLIAVIPMVYE
jgi:hypothetical protein